ncbi:MAG TPA: MBL fold metallo-hydrolase [Fimbriimonadaceae bacterium]|nr:MBL fold metallo-hydrolase [Fimbriimonadaceae bacterium]HRJ97110.1 MBL fold metallo-hydrolase [Fimbriimonadaceae bacterium]
MRVRAASLVGIVLGVALGAALEHRTDSSVTRLSFLAVGQGDCIVFQHHGKTVLIDAASKVDAFDAGERLASPELYRLGVKQLDLVLLSHPDADHVGGLPSLARRFPIGCAVVPARFRDHAEMRGWLEKARIPESRIVWLEGVGRVTIGDFELVFTGPNDRRFPEDNDGSMFVRLTGPGTSAVFTGDASSEVEGEMLKASMEWRAQILKAGHHGSRFSTGDPWLEAVSPTVAIVSCGRTNTYGHPAPDLLERLNRRGITVYRTDRQGTISFELSASGPRLIPSR